MTIPPIAWRTTDQTTIDRAGGELRLRLLCRSLMHRTFTIAALERDGWIGVRLTAPGIHVKGEDLRTAVDEWITIAGRKRWAPALEEQRDIVTGDALILEDLVRAEVARLEGDEGLSELELRYRYGDR